MAYPEPTPAVKGKAAREIRDELARKHPRRASGRWKGAKQTFEALKDPDKED
jgi:hypothetical protein